MASSIEPRASVPESRMTSGAIPLRIDQVDFPIGDVIDAAGEDYVLCFILQGCGDVRSAFDGRRAQQQYFRSGMFVPVTLPNTRAEFWMSAPMQHLVVALPQGIFDEWTRDRSATALESVANLQDRGFEDPLLAEVVRAAWCEAQSGNPNGSLYADALRMTLTGAILRRAGDAPPSDAPARRLSKSQIAVVKDYLRHHLGDQISLPRLAGVVGMRERTFSDAFKSATGQTPHQFLLALRIDRAKEHLAHGTMTIHEIAAATGFADQAHLTSAFSRRVGVPPARYRRNLRS